MSESKKVKKKTRFPLYFSLVSFFFSFPKQDPLLREMSRFPSNTRYKLARKRVACFVSTGHCITSCLLSKWMNKNPYGSLCAVSAESVSHLARHSANGHVGRPSRAASRELVRLPSNRVFPADAGACSLSATIRSLDGRSGC